MVDGNPNLSPYVPAPTWALPTMKKKRKLDWKSVGIILLLNLVLLILAGLALGTVYVLELRKEIQEIRQGNGEQAPITEKIVGVQNMSKPPKDLRIAAHLTGDSITAGSNPLIWDDRRGHAFTRGIVYKDRGLVVNETGIFFVYSKIYFRSHTCEAKKNLEHIVFKRTDQYHFPTALKQQCTWFLSPEDETLPQLGIAPVAQPEKENESLVVGLQPVAQNVGSQSSNTMVQTEDDIVAALHTEMML
eukprot:g43016.t1